MSIRHANSDDLKGLRDAPKSGLHILVAEDHPANMFVARRILESFGHKIGLAENGLTALQAVRDELYDLVLMDIRMPVMDGITATRHIRELSGPNSTIPVIAMTGYAMDSDQALFRSAGMDDYIAKPVEIEVLAAMIEKWRGCRSSFEPELELQRSAAQSF